MSDLAQPEWDVEVEVTTNVRIPIRVISVEDGFVTLEVSSNPIHVVLKAGNMLEVGGKVTQQMTKNTVVPS